MLNSHTISIAGVQCSRIDASAMSHCLKPIGLFKLLVPEPRTGTHPRLGVLALSNNVALLGA